MRDPHSNSLLYLTTKSNRTILIRLLVRHHIRPLQRHHRPITRTHLLRTVNRTNNVMSNTNHSVLTRQRNRRPRVLGSSQRSIRMLIMTMLPSISTVRRSSPLDKIMRTTRRLSRNHFTTTIRPRRNRPPTSFRLRIRITRNMLHATKMTRKSVPRLRHVLTITPLFNNRTTLVRIIKRIRMVRSIFRVSTISLRLNRRIRGNSGTLRRINNHAGMLHRNVRARHPTTNLRTSRRVSRPRRRHQRHQKNQPRSPRHTPTRPHRIVPRARRVTTSSVLMLIMRPRIKNILQLFQRNRLSIRRPITRLSKLLRRQRVFNHLPHRRKQRTNNTSRRNPRHHRGRQIPRGNRPPVQRHHNRRPPTRRRTTRGLRRYHNSLLRLRGTSHTTHAHRPNILLSLTMRIVSPLTILVRMIRKRLFIRVHSNLPLPRIIHFHFLPIRHHHTRGNRRNNHTRNPRRPSRRPIQIPPTKRFTRRLNQRPSHNVETRHHRNNANGHNVRGLQQRLPRSIPLPPNMPTPLPSNSHFIQYTRTSFSSQWC